jgi:hypothetical protein
MSLLTHRIGLTINMLFLAATCVYALTGSTVHQIGLAIVLFVARAVWAQAIHMRSMREGARRALQSARNLAMADQAPDLAHLDDQADYQLPLPIAAAKRLGH